jgi:ribosomal protein L37AE/L43A
MHWVKRNEDKPHRCPKCHAICAWDKEPQPKTILNCKDCKVKWRYGMRYPRISTRTKQILQHLIRG